MTAKQIQLRLKKLGLINEDGTPVLYSQFKNMSSVFTYKDKKVIYIGKLNENLFGFYPKEFAHDSILLKWAYKNYVQLVRGNTEPFTNGIVKWGNGAIPTTYSPIKVK
jgi:metallophosphoesterase superfamily enzyme